MWRCDNCEGVILWEAFLQKEPAVLLCPPCSRLPELLGLVMCRRCRRAYARALDEPCRWCANRVLPELAE